MLNSHAGMKLVHDHVEALFNEIGSVLDQLNIDTGLGIQHEASLKFGNIEQCLVITDKKVSMIAAWSTPYSNTLDRSFLTFNELGGALLLPREMQGRAVIRPLQPIKETKYDPEIDRSGQLGWREAGKSQGFVSNQSLAEKCAVDFVDLIDRYNTGRIKSMYRY